MNAKLDASIFLISLCEITLKNSKELQEKEFKMPQRFAVLRVRSDNAQYGLEIILKVDQMIVI